MRACLLHNLVGSNSFLGYRYFIWDCSLKEAISLFMNISIGIRNGDLYASWVSTQSHYYEIFTGHNVNLKILTVNTNGASLLNIKPYPPWIISKITMHVGTFLFSIISTSSFIKALWKWHWSTLAICYGMLWLLWFLLLWWWWLLLLLSIVC